MSTKTQYVAKTELIKMAHTEACSEWKRKIEAIFPSVFAQETTAKVKRDSRITMRGHGELMIAAISANKIVAIALENGNRWTEPIEVKNTSDITRAELEKAISSVYIKDIISIDGVPYSHTPVAIKPAHVVSTTFIKEAHAAAGANWKEKLEAEYPEIFAPKTKYARLIGDDRRLTLSTVMKTIDSIDMMIGYGLAPEDKSDSCIMIPKDTCARVEVTEHDGYWIVAFVKK